MSQFEIWFYRGVIGLLVALVLIGIKSILKKLGNIEDNTKSLSEQGIRYEGNLNQVKDRVNTHEKRINDHAERIRDVERKQDRCPNCTEP
jgi:hypothetical protein